MKRRSLKMAILIPVIGVLIAGVTLMVVIVGSVASSSTNDLTDRLISSRVNEYSNKFEALCMDAYSVVRSLAPVLNDVASHSQSPREEMLGVLSSVLMSDDNVLAVWTCWEPDAMDGRDSEFAGKGYHDNTGRYVPYVYKSGTGFEVEPLVDYTVPGDGDYYLGARNSGKPYITDPYPYDIGGKTVIIYSIAYPIIRGGTVVGVAGIDINLDELISIMNSGSILDDGYLSVISPGGLISTHRNESMILTDYKSTWLKDYSSYIDSIREKGGSFNVAAYSDVLDSHIQFLGSGVKIGNTERYWLVGGFVPQKTVSASSTTLIWIVVAVGLGLIILTGLTIFFLVTSSLRKLPSITSMAERIAVGDIGITGLDSNTAPTKNEVTQLERAFASITNSIQSQASVMEQIADGDYSVDIPVRSEADVMNKAINNMLGKTNDTLHQINNSTAQVSSGSKQIADGAQALAQGSTQQAASVEQLSASITEIAQKTKDNAEKAGKAAILANTIKQNAEKGSRQMDEMTAAVKDINQASQNIKKVIKVIDDIAFQTNILALNAAVEAARAGQHGKGFAVVAEEVRNLASKSADAAKETGEMIENSMEKADLGSRIADETAASLAEIVSGINESSQIVTEIAQSSDEQSAGIEQINHGIDQVSSVVQQNSATAEQSAAASEEMSGQSNMLEDLVAQFKLKDGPVGRKLPSRAARKEIAMPEKTAPNGSGDFGKY